MKELQTGLIFSAVFHVVVAAIAVAGIPSLARELPGLPQPIPIDVVIADEIRVTKPAPAAQKEKKTAPASSPTMTAAEPPAPRRDAVPSPDAVPKKTALKVRNKPEQRLIPRVTPKSKPRPPSQLNPGRLVALIDKSKKEQAAAKIEAKEDPKKLEEAVRRATLDARQARVATATLVAAVRRKVEECWVFFYRLRYFKY